MQAKPQTEIVAEPKVVDLEDFGSDFPFPVRAEKGNTIMSFKAHGTTAQPVQSTLLYGVDTETADSLCCFSRVPKEGGDAQDYVNKEDKDKMDPIDYAFKAPRNWVETIKKD